MKYVVSKLHDINVEDLAKNLIQEKKRNLLIFNIISICFYSFIYNIDHKLFKE